MIQYVVDKARSNCNVAMCQRNFQSKVKVALVGILTNPCHGKVDAHCSPGRDNVLGEWWGAGELGNIPSYLLLHIQKYETSAFLSAIALHI